MKQKGFAPILIIVIAIALGILYWMFSPIVKSNISLKVLKSKVTPEIFNIVERGFLDRDSVDKIISLQKSYSYDEARCNPVDDSAFCDYKDPSDTKEEKEGKYYKNGPMIGEYFFDFEKKYRDELATRLSENYNYVDFAHGCEKPDDISLFFTSKSQNIVLELQIIRDGDQKQFIDYLGIGTLDDLKWATSACSNNPPSINTQ